ncbi:glycosyltransferase-like domain-containing protein 1 [Pollicipes pollicipes]|uniref:glycosyltransferase-like domain-containing protein 1 n=1 Tax=Pollicipes pollicipes TaxID=41117 RepID=UPI001885483A|nr:glycosyltransferase-like domain-containing protein 1 [Pollicipes pollicipes]
MILLVEVFYAGSHRQLITTLTQGLQLDERSCHLTTMSGRKWHWRARTSALHLAEVIPRQQFSVLFTSSVTPLAELCGLRPDLAAPHKVLYFHENQLVYPVRKRTDTDFQYGYNQITACLVADEVVFNSGYNMESFLGNINHFMKTQPDYRPKGLADKIRSKCRVLYFPLCLPGVALGARLGESAEDRPLHILWPHRWEHDKNPALFFETMTQLHEEGLPFRLSVLGERCDEAPPEFERAQRELKDHIENWGYLESKEDYWKVLRSADVVVSTADHEFFGVAVLEAVASGCTPLCPSALVYPEWFEARHLFRTAGQLLRRLRQWCRRPGAASASGRGSVVAVVSVM